MLQIYTSSEGIPKRSVVCKKFSQIVQSFTPKEYPGMLEPSELVRSFANQGLPMPIRKTRLTDDTNNDLY